MIDGRMLDWTPSSMIRLHPLVRLISTARCKLFFSAVFAALFTLGRVGIIVSVQACVCVGGLGRLQGNLLFTLSAGESLYDASQVVLCNIAVAYESLAEERLLRCYYAASDPTQTPTAQCVSFIKRLTWHFTQEDRAEVHVVDGDVHRWWLIISGPCK